VVVAPDRTATHRAGMHGQRAAADPLERERAVTVDAANHRAAGVLVIPRMMAMRRVGAVHP